MRVNRIFELLLLSLYEPKAMKQTLLAALLSAVTTLSVIALLGRFSLATMIHFFGGVTYQEFDRFRDVAVQEGIPCCLWQGSDGNSDVRRLGSVGDSVRLSPRGAAQNEYWQFTVLRK